MINLKELSRLAGIEYWTLYYWWTKRSHKPINRQDRTHLANSIVSSVSPILKRLGYEVSVKALKK